MYDRLEFEITIKEKTDNQAGYCGHTIAFKIDAGFATDLAGGTITPAPIASRICLIIEAQNESF
ncbi:hypothetical protein Dda_6197 [Drechslerella dactyloides]|uniref:Uncharacterized protein n=1 Tax=Drechslerella dactyloides TaxID=74499 RepID=A0AAD6NJQ6_DREDA|nr:hypothetical protein Dda_6197 [Drechslerella dactyloides]